MCDDWHFPNLCYRFLRFQFRLPTPPPPHPPLMFLQWLAWLPQQLSPSLHLQCIVKCMYSIHCIHCMQCILYTVYIHFIHCIHCIHCIVKCMYTCILCTVSSVVLQYSVQYNLKSPINLREAHTLQNGWIFGKTSNGFWSPLLSGNSSLQSFPKIPLLWKFPEQQFLFRTPKSVMIFLLKMTTPPLRSFYGSSFILEPVRCSFQRQKRVGTWEQHSLLIKPSSDNF